LYNETKGEGIYPTPVIGVVGLLEDVGKAVPSGFQREGDAILHWVPYRAEFSRELDRDDFETPLGTSEFARVGFDEIWGTPPGIKIQFDRLVNDVLAQLAGEMLLHSACDVGGGGIAVALAKSCLTNGIGARVDKCVNRHTVGAINLFGEFPCNLLLSCSPESVDRIQEVVRKAGLVGLTQVGATTSSPMLEILWEGARISSGLDELNPAFASTLESQLAAEVVTA
jgi:phosphoribosylformylglycinamidine synthase